MRGPWIRGYWAVVALAALCAPPARAGEDVPTRAMKDELARSMAQLALPGMEKPYFIAYAIDGKIVCFFQSADKFKYRYATLGFNEAANLDEGEMWPTSYAIQGLTPAVEDKVRALVKKAVS